VNQASTSEIPHPETAAPRSAVSAWTELVKPRLTTLVVITTIVGYAAGAAGEFRGWTFLMTVLGTGLLGAAASALNQWWERAFDARMRRTRSRPIPAGAIAPGRGLVFGLVAAAAGLVLLARQVNGLTALLGAITLVVYILAYTPLKRRTTLCTVVGAVTGAIPPMMGWTAATGSIGAGAWVLFGILFVWQIPHFLAIAWLYREDYERGGFRMLPVVDPEGSATCGMVVLYSLALLPVSLAATLVGMSGWLYAVGALLLGGAMLALAIRLHRERTAAAARRLFLATITYLPILLALLVFDPTGLR
jgi:protoheme IX farnesyltransferase